MSGGEIPSGSSPELGGFEDGFVGFTPEMLSGLADYLQGQSDVDVRDSLLIKIENTLAERLKHIDEDAPEWRATDAAREHLREMTDKRLNEYFDGSSLET